MKKLRNTESPQHMRKTITEGKGKRRSRRSRNFFLFYILRREAANFFTYKAQFLSWRAKEDALRVVIKDIEEDMAEEDVISSNFGIFGSSMQKETRRKPGYYNLRISFAFHFIDAWIATSASACWHKERCLCKQTTRRKTWTGCCRFLMASTGTRYK